MQIGCDPKSDSTKNLTGGKKIPTVLDVIKENRLQPIELSQIVFEGFNGVLCVEAGGPTPGIGCAGRGIITAFEKLEELEAFQFYKPDIVIYDVLGDVVCGGFAMPIRGGYADEIYIVSSGEMMALYAADNINRAVNQFTSKGYAKVKGLILNERKIENELSIVENACKEMNTNIIKLIPRNAEVQQSENDGKTTVEAFPQGVMANHFYDLANLVSCS